MIREASCGRHWIYLLRGDHARSKTSTDTVEHLRGHRRRQATDRDEWGTYYEDQDLAFCKEDGAPIHPHAFSQAFERLGLETPAFTLKQYAHVMPEMQAEAAASIARAVQTGLA